MEKPKWIENTIKDNYWFHDGDELVVAVRVKSVKTKVERWDIDRITARCDGESVCFVHSESEETYDAWDWGDVDYFIPLNCKGPMTEKEALGL